MQLTPNEKKLRQNFLPGKITKDGFLGSDNRHIHDIIKMDLSVLETNAITKEQVADRLQFFIDEGKKGLGSHINLNDFVVQIQWDRGLMPCPFGDSGLHHKIIATVTNKETETIVIKYSQLNVHMIREHGFFEGKDSLYRIDPEILISSIFID